MQYLIMCRSLTQAQQAARLLEKHGITASVVKAPHGLVNSGCVYAITFNRRYEDVISILRKNNMLYGKRFKKNMNGEYREV